MRKAASQRATGLEVFKKSNQAQGILTLWKRRGPGSLRRRAIFSLLCLKLKGEKENRGWTCLPNRHATMDDHAFRFGNVTKRVKGWFGVRLSSLPKAQAAPKLKAEPEKRTALI